MQQSNIGGVASWVVIVGLGLYACFALEFTIRYLVNPSDLKDNQINHIPRYAIRNLGPFFNADKVAVWDILLHRGYQHGNWSKWRNTEEELFEASHHQFFGMSTLKKSRYERFLCIQVQKDSGNQEFIHAMQNYFMETYYDDEIDSIEFQLIRFRDGSPGDTLHFKFANL